MLLLTRIYRVKSYTWVSHRVLILGCHHNVYHILFSITLWVLIGKPDMAETVTTIQTSRNLALLWCHYMPSQLCCSKSILFALVGWRFDGMLCEADNTETGAMWECPLLLELTQTQASPKTSAQTTGGIQSIHDSHTQLPTPTGKPASFREARNQGGQTDKAVESEPGNFQEMFGRIEPEPIASTSGKAAGGVSLLSRQISDLSVVSQESGSGLAQQPAAQQPAAQQQRQRPRQHTHFLCISPDAPTNPVLYWLGAFDHQNTKFILDGAKGPLKLDLGDILYAPNLMIDGKVSAALNTR